MALVATPPEITNSLWQEDKDDLINVFLRMWDGKTLCCTINPKKAAISHIYSALEQQVLQSYPYDEGNFYFVMQGKPVNPINCHTMAWNNGSTVFVQYRKRGGCFIFSASIFCIIVMAILGSVCTCGSSLLIVPILLPLLFILPLFCL